VLLDGGADPFLTLPDRTTTLMIASGLGYGGLRGEAIRIVVPTPEGAVEAATLLLDRGVDVNAFNAAGQTALHGAVGRGEPVVEFLVARGATLFKNKAGFTPLDVALGQGGGRGGRGGVVREGAAAILRKLAPPGPSSRRLPSLASPRWPSTGGAGCLAAAVVVWTAPARPVPSGARATRARAEAPARPRAALFTRRPIGLPPQGEERPMTTSPSPT
jgi:ankyrin repeat protein